MILFPFNKCCFLHHKIRGIQLLWCNTVFYTEVDGFIEHPQQTEGLCLPMYALRTGEHGKHKSEVPAGPVTKPILQPAVHLSVNPTVPVGSSQSAAAPWPSLF